MEELNAEQKKIIKAFENLDLDADYDLMSVAGIRVLAADVTKQMYYGAMKETTNKRSRRVEGLASFLKAVKDNLIPIIENKLEETVLVLIEQCKDQLEKIQQLAELITTLKIDKNRLDNANQELLMKLNNLEAIHGKVEEERTHQSTSIN